MYQPLAYASTLGLCINPWLMYQPLAYVSPLAACINPWPMYQLFPWRMYQLLTHVTDSASCINSLRWYQLLKLLSTSSAGINYFSWYQLLALVSAVGAGISCWRWYQLLAMVSVAGVICYYASRCLGHYNQLSEPMFNAARPASLKNWSKSYLLARPCSSFLPSTIFSVFFFLLCILFWAIVNTMAITVSQPSTTCPI